jgi:hypothetical protein
MVCSSWLPQITRKLSSSTVVLMLVLVSLCSSKSLVFQCNEKFSNGKDQIALPD